jgi:hypothetical protein
MKEKEKNMLLKLKLLRGGEEDPKDLHPRLLPPLKKEGLLDREMSTSSGMTSLSWFVLQTKLVDLD